MKSNVSLGFQIVAKVRARALRLLAVPVSVLGVLGSGCGKPECPTGFVASQGACFPQALVASLDGGRPMLCAEPCVGATPFCDYQRGACAECLDDAACSGATPHCDPTAGECAQCTRDSHCGGATPACDPGSRTCVACVTNDTCPLATPRCDPGTHTCTTCVVDADCSRSGATPYCDASSNTCVSCLPRVEATACGGTSCDPVARTCTDTRVASRNVCTSCRADSECHPNQRCVTRSWLLLTETVCLWDAEIVECGYVAPVAPYGKIQSLRDVDGTMRSVCATGVSCEAAESYRLRRTCNGESALPHSDCGLGAGLLDGSFCDGAIPGSYCLLTCTSTDPHTCLGEPARCLDGICHWAY